MTREEAIQQLNIEKDSLRRLVIDCGITELKPKFEAISMAIEALDMAIEALQAEPTHGRLIDADALMEYCSNQKSKTISNNDIARFPTVSADRLHGEWLDEDWNKVPLDENGFPLGSCYCSQCYEWLVGSDEYAIKGNFCPNCGADMKGGEEG